MTKKVPSNMVRISKDQYVTQEAFNRMMVDQKALLAQHQAKIPPAQQNAPPPNPSQPEPPQQRSPPPPPTTATLSVKRGYQEMSEEDSAGQDPIKRRDTRSDGHGPMSSTSTQSKAYASTVAAAQRPRREAVQNNNSIRACVGSEKQYQLQTQMHVQAATQQRAAPPVESGDNPPVPARSATGTPVSVGNSDSSRPISVQSMSTPPSRSETNSQSPSPSSAAPDPPQSQRPSASQKSLAPVVGNATVESTMEHIQSAMPPVNGNSNSGSMARSRVPSVAAGKSSPSRVNRPGYMKTASARASTSTPTNSYQLQNQARSSSKTRMDFPATLDSALFNFQGHASVDLTQARSTTQPPSLPLQYQASHYPPSTINSESATDSAQATLQMPHENSVRVQGSAPLLPSPAPSHGVMSQSTLSPAMAPNNMSRQEYLNAMAAARMQSAAQAQLSPVQGQVQPPGHPRTPMSSPAVMNDNHVHHQTRMNVPSFHAQGSTMVQQSPPDQPGRQQRNTQLPHFTPFMRNGKRVELANDMSAERVALHNGWFVRLGVLLGYPDGVPRETVLSINQMQRQLLGPGLFSRGDQLYRIVPHATNAPQDVAMTGAVAPTGAPSHSSTQSPGQQVPQQQPPQSHQHLPQKLSLSPQNQISTAYHQYSQTIAPQDKSPVAQTGGTKMIPSEERRPLAQGNTQVPAPVVDLTQDQDVTVNVQQAQNGRPVQKDQLADNRHAASNGYAVQNAAAAGRNGDMPRFSRTNRTSPTTQSSPALQNGSQAQLNYQDQNGSQSKLGHQSQDASQPLFRHQGQNGQQPVPTNATAGQKRRREDETKPNGDATIPVKRTRTGPSTPVTAMPTSRTGPPLTNGDSAQARQSQVVNGMSTGHIPVNKNGMSPTPLLTSY